MVLLACLWSAVDDRGPCCLLVCTAKAAEMTWTLCIKIDKTWYRVLRLTPDPAVAKAAIRLQKTDGKFYDLHRDKFGVSCSCPSFLWRRKPEGCKHVVSCTQAELI